MEKRGKDREHPYSHQLQIISAIIVLGLILLDVFILKFSSKLLAFIPLWVQLVCFTTSFTLALVLGFKSHNILFKGGEEGPTSLITDGIFAHTRHPLYLAILLFHLSFILLTMSILAFFAWIFVILIYNKLASAEEQILEGMFGDEYLKYKKQVPKWIPR